MVPIDKKEIHGIDLRIIISVITSVVIIVSSVLGTHYSTQLQLQKIDATMRDNLSQSQQGDKILEIRLNAMEIQIKEQSLRIDDIERKIH